MKLSRRQKYLLLIGGIALCVFWRGPQWIGAYKNVPSTVLLPKELTHAQAIQGCRQSGGRLPALIEVIRLEHSGLLVHRRTDFWSTATLGFFAFGWSTRKNMLSFDPKDDFDSVICIVD